MLVAGTAAALSAVILNERKLATAHAGAGPAARTPALPFPVRASLPDPRRFLVRRLWPAAAFAFACIAVVAAAPVMTALAMQSQPSPASQLAGPPAELRAAAGAAGNWEQAYSTSVPPADEIGAALMAAAEHQHYLDMVSALQTLAAQEAARTAAATRSIAVGRTAARANPPQSMNATSGYAAGTVLRARITVYGCTGPGGGFCGNMASGIPVFEGAAACSRDLPFGTRLRIIGDPTGRIYECLDRGALGATWVDVFFHNTSEGIRWAGLLGGTRADIEIVN
jgi:hypothetical protein